MTTAPDPFVAEQALAVLAQSPRPIAPPGIAGAIGEGVNAVLAPLRLLVAEGLATKSPQNTYAATTLGLVRATDALAADMDDGVQEDAAAITAAFVVLDPAATAAALVASMYELDPEPYNAKMSPHFATARKKFAEARRYDSGNFAGGPGRAHRARLSALDSLVAAANIVDPTKTRVDVLRDMFRAAPKRALAAALVAAAAPRQNAVVASAAPARRRAPLPTPKARRKAPQPASHGCCGTAGSCRGNCRWPR